ncbi:MAG: hypothetical protein AAB267_01080 [Candidatus Desantisbacteria bacterium]
MEFNYAAKDKAIWGWNNRLMGCKPIYGTDNEISPNDKEINAKDR